MAFQLVRAGDYPGTDLPVFMVFDADEYNDPTITEVHAIGEVWAFGVKGVTGKYVPCGVHYQLTGDYSESPVFPVGAYADAARAMITKYEGNREEIGSEGIPVNTCRQTDACMCPACTGHDNK